MNFAKPLALERVWRRLFSFFDDGPLWPRRIAERGFLTRYENRVATRWLRRVEEIARRLFLIEALRLDPPPTPTRPPRKKATRKPKPDYCCEHVVEPNEWRVSFRMGAAPRKRASHRRLRSRFYVQWTQDGYRYRRRPRVELHPAMPVSRRAEAMWRALRDRRAYVQRLARRLSRREGRKALITIRKAHPALPHLSGPTFRAAGPLLAVVHDHFSAALRHALARHALDGWA